MMSGGKHPIWRRTLWAWQLEPTNAQESLLEAPELELAPPEANDNQQLNDLE